jgi:putative addiction module component (TIGR02574 family)
VAQTLPNPPPGFDDLSPAEKLAYVRRLWAQVIASPDTVEITDAQRAELKRRLEAHRANPEAARPWHEVRRELFAKWNATDDSTS